MTENSELSILCKTECRWSLHLLFFSSKLETGLGGISRMVWNMAVIGLLRIWLLALFYIVIVNAECKEWIENIWVYYRKMLQIM